MAEIKDSKLIRDALGSPVPQYWDETSQMYIARTVDGSFADVDFSKVRMIRDKLGSPIPQLWDTETARFVPGKGGGNGEVTIESVPGLKEKLDTTTAQLAETAKQKKDVFVYVDDFWVDGYTSWTPAIQAAVDSIPEAGRIMFKSKTYEVDGSVLVLDKTIDFVGVAGQFHVPIGGNHLEYGTILKWTGTDINISMLKFFNSFGSVVRGIGFLCENTYAITDKITGIEVDCDRLSRYVIIEKCSFKNIFIGIHMGSSPLGTSSSEFLVDACNFWRCEESIRITSYNVYDFTIRSCYFYGWDTHVKYHIRCINGHFNTYSCYFGPLDATGISVASIAIEKGYANIYDPYAEAHNAPFLIWDTGHPNSQDAVQPVITNLFGGVLLNNNAPTTYDIKTNAGAQLNLYGVFMYRSVRLDNPNGYVSCFGMTTPKFEGVIANCQQIGGRYDGREGVIGYGKSTIVGTGNIGEYPTLALYDKLNNRDFKTWVNGSRVESELTGINLGYRVEYDTRKLNLGSTNWELRLSSSNGGAVTLSTTASTTTVLNTKVTNKSIIVLFPTNDSAARLVASVQSPYIQAKTVGLGFAIRTADNNIPVTNCTFNYLIFDANY